MPVDLLAGQNNEREPIDLLAPTQPDAPDIPLISANDIEERFNLIRQFTGPDLEKKARDSASIAATYNISEGTAFDMHDSFLQNMDTTNLWDKATGSFKAGWGDVYSSVGGIMKRKGLAAGDDYADFGERLKRAYIPASDQSEFTWRKMKDPEWYATTIMRSVPFTLSLLPAAVVGAYAAGTAGGAMGLGLFGKTVLGAIGGAALSRPVESSFEAQGAYEEAKGKGFTDDDSEIAANQVFWENMKLSGLDAAEFATAFLPMGKIAGNTVKRALGKRILAATGKTSAKLGAVGAMEMMEERYQEKSVMDATGDPASLFDFDDPRLNEAGAAGAVFGIGLGGAGSVWTALRDKVTTTDDQKVKFIYDKTKKQAIVDGANVVEADRIALDAVAATPEGKAHIEKVVGDLVDLANGRPVKERTESKTKSDQPFIFGVNEDQNGEVTTFTMADPVSGETFEVPALKSEEKDKMTVTPDMEAVNAKIKDIRAIDQEDTALDKLIQGEEDIDQVAGQMFGEAEIPLDGISDSGVQYSHETLFDNERGVVSAQVEDGKTDSGTVPDDNGIVESRPEVVSQEVGEYKAVKSKIESSLDLAQLSDANIGMQAQENLIVVITDDDNQIIKVYRHSLGTANFSTAVPSVIIGNALNTTKAKKIWLAHNHPAGDAKFSDADQRISEGLSNLAKGTGLEIGDFIAVGNDQYASDKNISVEPIGEYEAGTKIPVSERVFINKVNSEKQVKDFNGIVDFANKNDLRGIVLFDNKNRPTAFIRTQDFSKIRGEMQKALLSAVEKTNSVSIAAVRLNDAIRGDEVSNLKRFAAAADLRLLDVVDKNGSLANSGAYLKSKDIYFYSGIDPTMTVEILRGLKNNIQEAWPHLEALGLKAYESGKSTYSAWSAEMKSYLGDLWESFKGSMAQVWESVKAFNEQLGDRGSISNKKKYDVDEVNELLDMAARQDKSLEISETPSYDDVRKKAAQMAWEKINKKIDFQKRKENAALKRQGRDDARLLPAFQAINYIVEKGGLDKAKLLKDYGKETVDELSKRRIGLIRENGTVENDVVADQLGYESGDDMINDILDWKGLDAESKKQADAFQYKFGELITAGELDSFNELLMAEEEKIMNQLTAENRPKPAKGLKSVIRKNTGQAQPKDKMVTEYDALAEAFRKEAQIARQAFVSGKKGEIEKSKAKMRWLMKRRESIKNVRDYFKLTDAEIMSVTNRRNPGLMDDAEFSQFLKDVELKAVLLADNKQAKIELMMLIESKRLQKVDNYRQAIQLPTIDKMTTEQLREFAKLLEPFQDDDVFLTQRELETVDRTDLKGIKTIREALERLAKEAGVDVEELNKVHVAALDQFRYDSSLRDRDPFFDILVTRMTEAKLGAELRAHGIESQVYDLAKKSDKSRERGVVDRMIPQDDLIMAFLEAPMERKAAVAEQMTPEQLNYAHFMQQYFSEALNYLIAAKSLERGRENYFVHIRRSFFENLKDGGVKKAISELFKTYQQDQMVFNILDDDTGNILPLEKFFQFSLQRTETMDPTRNVTKAFLTYMRTFEKKKMFDAIIPKLDIYAQALTPVKYTPRGLEIDRSLKTFVNKWINNKKGRRLSFDSTLRQGGPIDVGIRALRSFTTILDLGLSPIAQIASVLGEQVTNATMIGSRGMAKGTARMQTDKGKRILDKYEAFVGRSLWEEFTAPGKEVTERFSDMLFAGFHLSSVLSNKQSLLASLSEEEWKNEEISTERLAEMQLDMGRFRVVPGTGSLVGSTSVGDAAMQYKKWAVPIARTMIDDGEKLIRSIKEGKSLDNRTKKELIRFAYLTGAVFIVGAMAGADDTDDESYIGKFKARMYREAMTLTQGINPLLFVGVPRTWTWVKDTIKALKDLVMLEEYKTKEGLKGVGELKRQFVPGVVRSLPGVEEKE